MCVVHDSVLKEGAARGTQKIKSWYTSSIQFSLKVTVNRHSQRPFSIFLDVGLAPISKTPSIAVLRKLSMKRNENSTSLQTTYAKHKDGIVKKASELSVLCDTDVALILFSPTGHLTSFASKGSVEDIFLSFVDRPYELRGGPIRNEEYLSRRLKRLKYERQMLEKVANIEALEDKLDKLNQRHHVAHEKMRMYEPNVEKINSILEAEIYQQFLMTAMQRIQLSKAKLLSQVGPHGSENIETGKVNMEDAAFITDYCADMDQNSMQLRNKGAREPSGMWSSAGFEGRAGMCFPMGPHLSLSFIKSQKQWNAVGGEMTPKLDSF